MLPSLDISDSSICCTKMVVFAVPQQETPNDLLSVFVILFIVYNHISNVILLTGTEFLVYL